MGWCGNWKKRRYVPQLKRNLISVGALEILDLEVSIRDGVLKMTKGSMVVLKSIRRNNLYYLKGSTVTGQVATFTDSDDDSIRLWHIKLGHTGESLCKLLQSKVGWKMPEPANWSFVNIVSSERRPRWNSAQWLTAPRGFWIMFTSMFGDLYRWLF